MMCSVWGDGSLLFLSLCLLSPALNRSAIADEKTDFFESKIRPVLVENCYRCHSAKQKVEGGLRLDSRNGMREGGDSGAAVTPKDIDDSLLISALKYESFEMPPDRKLADHVIKDFEHWIESGAVDPREEETLPTEVLEASGIDYEAGREFWAFNKPKRQIASKHSHSNWSKNPIDDFVAVALDNQKLKPSEPASKETLLRRISFDLVGLPPQDTSPTSSIDGHQNKTVQDDELGRYVDSLLSSESFGEHWARMWLDLMRFADDQAHIVGNNTSLCFPNAYMYRDWVIEAFNADLSYDRFIELQLAADLITPDDPTDDVALGFVGLGPKYYRRGAPEVMADEMEDRVDVLSRGLLGLTVACARCHDHKYDPIGTADYYALAGVFASVEMYNKPLKAKAEADKKGQAKKPEDALHIIREKKVVDLPVLVRGDVKRPGPIVNRGFLQVLSPEDLETERVEFKQGSGRAELAAQIASMDNPLTARVFVNRVWAKLIGRPLVGTQSNFGKLGEKPSHPELLDDLSVRFMENGWSLKWLCREIVMSATYRQKSAGNAQAFELDPENVWLARMNRKRLSIEQWRDALLLASGQLNESLTDEHLDPSTPKPGRRTVYSDSSRLRVNAMLSLFDYPDPNVHSASRAKTTTASQKLFLMNSPFMVNCSRALTQELKQLPSRQAIRIAYSKLFSRTPRLEEIQAGETYVASGESRLQNYIHALMMTNEALFID